MSLSSTSSTPKLKVIAIPVKDVIVKNRGRQKFTRILELAESIQKYGLIHPIVVAPFTNNQGETKYELVAGERRLRGTILAGSATIPATFREETTPSVLAEIEFEENVCRVDISFEEEGILFEKIQRLKKAENPDWTQADTARMTGRSTGDVSSKIQIAKKFRERPDLKAQCADGKMPFSAALQKIAQIEEAEKVQRLSDQGQIQLSTELLHGDCLQLIKTLADESIDLLVTDPPYGLERLEKIRTTSSNRFTSHTLMSSEHNQNIDSIIELLTKLAPELHRVLKPGSHFYMFCGFQYIGKFIDALFPFLMFQPPVLVWDRGKPSAPGYGYNYLSRLEVIIYGHKPPREKRRLNQNMYNLFQCPDVPKPLRRYPTEKPEPLLQILIQNSSSPNAMVLDPFAGSGSTLTAAKNCGRRAIGFEINKEAFLRAQKRILGEDDG